MFIKIDYREKELQDKLSYYISFIPAFRNIKVISENLPIGDIIVTDNNEDILIIERKSVGDLMSSIKDGRYEEQSYRLNGNKAHNHNIIYLIEGDINKLNMNMFKDVKIEKLTFYSAIFSLNYYKGFSVLRTLSLDETALFICNSTIKLMKGLTTNRKGFYSNIIPREISKEILNELEQQSMSNISENIPENIPENTEQSEKDYIGLVKKVKKENITPENIDEIMLCQIPGVSSTTAISIIKEFKTFSNLIKCLEEKPDCLNNISNTNNKGQTRKITKTSIANISKFLLKK
jgi:crossover junction endonuclease MUS81